MRILHLIPNLNKGGAERLVLDICNELSKKNEFVIKLITFSSTNAYENLIENINWVSVYVKVELSILKKNKINILELQKEILDFQPDIIHTHLFEAEIISRSCNYPKAKWFSHCHDNMFQFKTFSIKTIFHKNIFTNYYEKHYLFKKYKRNCGTHFIAISNDTKKYYDNNAKPYLVSLLHNAINYNLFFRPKNYSFYKKKLSLINIGSFVDKKNQEFLIDVAIVLKIRNIDFTLNFLGDGINKLRLVEKVKKNNLVENVFFLGNVNNVEEYLFQSDIYVHSATYEPLGLVLLEAMASGLPVITLDGRGNRDIIENDKNGYMIPEIDSVAFVNKILELWNNKEKYKEVSLFAQEYAKNYDIKKYVEKLIDLYML